MHDGNRNPAFAADEYALRARRVRERLGADELDALVVVEPGNINWLTGYDARSWYTPQAVLVTQGEATPVWIGRQMDEACAVWTTHLPREAIIGYTDEHVAGGGANAFAVIGDIIASRTTPGARIGYEADAGTFTPRGFRALENSLPSTTLIDADGLVNRLRTIKSPAELSYMREAGVIATAAMDHAAQLIRPGVRECDVMAEVYRESIRGTADFGGDCPIWPNISTGRQTDAPHLTWSDREFTSDTPVNLELGGCRARYYSALSRSFYLGQAPAGLQRIAAAVDDGYTAALEALRPGRRCDEVAAAFADAAAAGGVHKTSRIGYSIGIGYPTASWSERSISLYDKDLTPIEANMTFHVMLGIWVENEGGYVFSETLAVTDSGPEIITTAPRGLRELEARG